MSRSKAKATQAQQCHCTAITGSCLIPSREHFPTPAVTSPATLLGDIFPLSVQDPIINCFNTGYPLICMQGFIANRTQGESCPSWQHNGDAIA